MRPSPGAPQALGSVADGLLQRGDAAVAHVRRRQGDVAEGRGFELAQVAHVRGDVEAAQSGHVRGSEEEAVDGGLGCRGGAFDGVRQIGCQLLEADCQTVELAVRVKGIAIPPV